MKKILLFLISLFIGIGIFIWIGRIVGWQEIKNAFLVFSGWKGIIIFTLTLLIAAIGNLKWQVILEGEGIKISFWNLLRPYLIGFAVMFLAPILLGGGEVLRGYDLKRKTGISFSKAMSSIIIDRILEWTVNLIIIFLGALFFLYEIGLPPKNLLIIFGGVFSIFLAAIILFYFKVFKEESLVKALGKIFKSDLDSQPLETEKEIFNFFKVSKKAAKKSFSLSLLRAGIMHLRTLLLIIFLGKRVSLLSALSVLGFTYLATMIPIPTALGSHEALQTFSFKSLSLGISTATAFTMIIRGAELLIALAGVMIILRMGAIFAKNFLFKNNRQPINKNDI